MSQSDLRSESTGLWSLCPFQRFIVAYDEEDDEDDGGGD